MTMKRGGSAPGKVTDITRRPWCASRSSAACNSRCSSRCSCPGRYGPASYTSILRVGSAEHHGARPLRTWNPSYVGARTATPLNHGSVATDEGIFRRFTAKAAQPDRPRLAPADMGAADRAVLRRGRGPKGLGYWTTGARLADAHCSSKTSARSSRQRPGRREPLEPCGDLSAKSRAAWGRVEDLARLGRPKRGGVGIISPAPAPFRSRSAAARTGCGDTTRP